MQIAKVMHLSTQQIEQIVLDCILRSDGFKKYDRVSNRKFRGNKEGGKRRRASKIHGHVSPSCTGG